MKEEKENVCGQNCDVYSRVCGYIRPVNNFNKGKEQEYKDRKKFDKEFKKDN